MRAAIARRARRVRVEAFAGATVVGSGAALLLARPFAGGSAQARTALFAASYLVLAAAAMAIPVGAGVSPRRAGGLAGAIVVGVIAIGAGTLASGPAVPAPLGAAALPLALLAALAEEALFRRVLYARLERLAPAIAVIGSAALFALVHLPAYGTTALPVDLGAGLLFGWQRWASGTWTAPAATHAFANLVAVLR